MNTETLTQLLSTKFKSAEAVPSVDETVIFIEDGLIAIISEVSELSINTNHYCFEQLDDTLKSEVFEILLEYAKTPISERGIK